MLIGYLINNLPERTLDLFEQTKTKLNEVLCSIVFNACATMSNERAIRLGNHLLKEIPDQFYYHIPMTGSALNMLIKFGQVSDAERLFNSLKKKDSSTFSIMMIGYNSHEQPDKALTLFEQILREKITPNDVIYVGAVNAAARIGLRSVCNQTVQLIPGPSRTNPLINNALIDMWVRRLYFREIFVKFSTVILG